ncbi:MAG TPA: hypothetical protein VGI22_25585 [Xanthobacteraceae bacterium]|jgi:predicted  nucleic acid-binding Zn-ribbon protein
MRRLKSPDDKPWDAMTVDEKLEALRREMEVHLRQSAATAKALDEMRKRMKEMDRRQEDLMFDHF